MRIKRVHVMLVMTLLIGLTFQSFMLPACGAESFKLRIESKLSEVVLNWTPVAGATSYDIYRSLSKTSKLATVAADTLKYRDRSVTRGKSYTYWIIAKQDGIQLATSNSWVAVPGNKQSSPSAPTIRAKAFSTPYVELSWSGSGNAVYYELEQKTGNYDFRIRATLNKETKYKDYFVSRGGTYTYRVKAFNEYGDSDYSNEITVSVKPTGAVPDVPAGFAARNDRFYNSDTKKYEDNKQVELSWSYNDNDAQEFIIEKKKSLEGNYTKIIAVPGFNLFTNRKSGTYSYDSSASFKHYYYFDTNISTDSTYYYRIKACNNNGESAYSREIRVDTLVTKAPSPPADLQAEAAPGRVNLTWSNNSTNEKGLRIERCAINTPTFSEIGSVKAGVNSYRDNSVSPNTVYQYRVRAFNDKGNSKYSNEAIVITLAAPDKRGR